MPRPKKYEDAAARQREYRRRKFMGSLSPELRRFEIINRQHDLIKVNAQIGNPLAAQIVGSTPFDTAWNLAAYFGDQCLHWACQEAARRSGDGKAPDVKSE